MNALKWLDNRIARIEGWIIIVFLWFMVILTFLQVSLRGLYTHAHLEWANAMMGYLDWSESLVRLLVLWLTFLGASLLTRENRHIRIDLFSSLLPPNWLCARDVILSIAGALVSAVMLVACISYIRMEKAFGGNIFLSIPNWIGQLILPVGFGLILFRFVIRSLDSGIDIIRGKVR